MIILAGLKITSGNILNKMFPKLDYTCILDLIVTTTSLNKKLIQPLWFKYSTV